jgi:hypothetical protein
VAFEDFWMSQTEEPTGASLRFSGGQGLTWMQGVPTNRPVWTLSFWMKRATVNAATLQQPFFWNFGNANFHSYINFSNAGVYTDQLNLLDFNTATTGEKYTNAQYRDPSAWYHVVISGTASGVVSNWIVNGTASTATTSGTVNGNGFSYVNNNSCPLSIGRGLGGFSGYLSDIFFVDGQALTPTTFGYFDPNGIWVPKTFSAAKAAVVAAGGFGANGFALEFKSANFNSGTLVWADQSGNGNDFTANWNCQVGAGGGTTGTDILSDSPTTNYAVINPLYNGASTSRANLTTANTTGKPSILPAFANTGTVPQTVGVNGAGVSWNGTEAGWTSTGNISFGQQSTFATATGLSAVKLNAATIPDGSTGFQAVLDTGANILTTAQATFPNGMWWVKDRVNANQHQLIFQNGWVFTSPTIPPPTNTYVAPTGNSVAWSWNNSDPANLGFQAITVVGDYTSDQRVPHNLGVPPEFIIYMSATTLNPTAQYDPVYHKDIPGSLQLQSSAAQLAFSLFPFIGSTEIGIISNGPTGPGDNVGLMLFRSVPGLSSISSYTGNGSTDGPFAYCGFLPAFVLIKCSSTTGNWEIYDNARNTYNPETLALQPNLTNAESTIDGIDFLSNGFKIRTTDANFNTSGQTYIYAAFAENPFGGSNVAPVTAR